jgi:hypothetical protein
MNPFGKYAILDNAEHAFVKEPELTWTIKPPTSGDELDLSKFIVQNRITTGIDGIRREAPPTSLEIAHREIALTFAGTTILGEDGKPILEPNAGVNTIENVLKSMPHEMVIEIWHAVGDACVTWGPAKTENPKA